MFSREELLGGLPARRASTLLFAIESRTALLVARDRRAMATYETDRTEADEESAFFSALGEGRTPPLQPTVQDLDRHADRWADLLPGDAEGRAALLKRIAEKYGLPVQANRIRSVLGADDPAVAAAFERQAGRTLAEFAAVGQSTLQRLHWWRARAAARVEDLPPFWLAFALTITETVGGGILALPIAFAGLGLAAATALLIAFGLINVLTVAALVEGITRNGNMRYGSAYFGRLVGDYLGRPGYALLTPALLILNAGGFVVALVGFGSTLEGATGVPVAAWAAVLFAVNLIFLWRGSFDATVASALTIGAVNIVLIVAICTLALASAASSGGTASSAAVPVEAGASVLELVFGVALLAYFGHTSAGNAAKVVLTRDPTGRSLLWGNVAAMACAMALYVFAVASISLALGPDVLVGYAGTVITPLAEKVGPIINVLGSIFVVLAIGLGSIYVTLSLYNQMAEFAPSIAVAPRPGASIRERLPGFAVRAGPVIGIFVAVELLIAFGSISFTAPLGLIGTLTLPLLGGIFPMLMLVAARRKGDRIPVRVIGFLGNPIVVAFTMSVFFFAVLAYGLFIWTGPVERLLACGVAAAIVIVGLVTWRRGAFRGRTVIEYRVEAGRPTRAILTATANGRPIDVDFATVAPSGDVSAHGASMPIADPGTLHSIQVTMPGPGTSATPELKVWAHTITPQGDSVGVPGTLVVTEGSAAGEVPLPGTDGQAIIGDAGPFTGITLTLAPRR